MRVSEFACNRKTRLFYGLPQYMIHILNRHDPGSAMVHNSFALTVCREVPV